MKVTYVPRKFKQSSLDVIEQAEAICLEYQAQGFALTLRQLYYQFVARGLVKNNQQSYNRLGEIISDARLAGQFDWDFIVDRTRNLADLPHWTSPAQMIEQAAEQYRTDTWAPQKKRVEVWIEKDAAIGVIEKVCRDNDVPYFSCRGYTSQSEMYVAGTRIGEYLRNGEQTLILHIGDHDPSGLDMTRDIEDRLRLFIHQDWINEFGVLGRGSRGDIRTSMRDRMRHRDSFIEDHELPFQVKRIALTMEQVEEYNPPPNYAKQTDARWQKYNEETGLDESWELDALDPSIMEALIQDEIDAFMDNEEFGKAEARQERDRSVLIAIKDNWKTIAAVHGGNTDDGADDEEDEV